jgi:hypothetical protein
VIVLRENVYKIFTHKSNKPDSSHSVSPYDNHPLCPLSPTNILPVVGYLFFMYVSSSSVKTPSSCHHKSVIWYSFLSSLRMCFPTSCPWSFSWDNHPIFQRSGEKAWLSVIIKLKTKTPFVSFITVKQTGLYRGIRWMTGVYPVSVGTLLR